MLEGFDPRMIVDLEGAREAIVRMLNIIEGLQQEIVQLRQENQRLRDEINRLKGEKGRPDIKPNKKPSPQDYSSERQRYTPTQWQKRSKLSGLEIHETKPLEVDKNVLPPDAVFKGYEEVVVQDLKVEAHNTLFRKEKYYSPGEKKTYMAEVSTGYEGGFGPGVKSWALTLYFGCNVSQPKVLEFFREAGVVISAGQVSGLLIKGQETFHLEKEDLHEAALHSSPWQQIDETGIRVDGVNWHCHVVCNPLYTGYFTSQEMSRLVVLDILRNFRARRYLINEDTILRARRLQVPEEARETLRTLRPGELLSEEEFLTLLDERLPALSVKQRSKILECAAIAAYHTDTGFPVMQLLLSDDAGTFKQLTGEHALCWVHDGRHYNKMEPCVEHYRKILDGFRDRYWQYYDRLLEYKKNPRQADAVKLEADFDELFSTHTSFEALDDRIARTKADKDCLLMVLKYPELPLHNNAAELAARQLVRKRDVSLSIRTQDGRRAWDTFLTLAGTAKKLGVSLFRYINDRIRGTYAMPHLADLLLQRAEETRLGACWAHGP